MPLRWLFHRLIWFPRRSAREQQRDHAVVVGSCRKCLHFQRETLTPELKECGCSPSRTGISDHQSSPLPAGPSLNCVYVFIDLCMCVCVRVRERIWGRERERASKRASTCDQRVSHPSVLRWHITVNEWYLCSVCVRRGEQGSKTRPPQSPHLQPPHFLCQSFACFAFKEFVQLSLGSSYGKWLTNELFSPTIKLIGITLCEGCSSKSCRCT